MVNLDRTHVRYASQDLLIRQAIAGDAEAVQKVISYLNAQNPDLRRMFQAALHDVDTPELWSKLIHCLGYCCWEEDTLNRPEFSSRAFQSIAEAFIIDESEQELEAKQTALLPALESTDVRIQIAAAYLLGLKGDLRALPVLKAVIGGEIGGTRVEEQWQLRAIEALAAINDEACAESLLKALAMGRGEIHVAAGRALHQIGRQAEPALLAGLHHPDQHIRWHAARALGQIGNPHAVDILVDGLDDPSQEVAWITARVLANMDLIAVPAILEKISTTPMNEPFRQVAYHSLHSMPSRSAQEYLQPILEALHSQAGALDAQRVAQQLLSEWKSHAPQPKPGREDRKFEIPSNF